MSGRVLAWLGLAAAWSWPWAGLLAGVGDGRPGLLAWGLGIVYVLGPWLASLVWARWVVREPLLPEDREPRFNGVVMLAWVAPVLLVWAAAAVAHLAGWGRLDLSGQILVENARALHGDEAAEKTIQRLGGSSVPYLLQVGVQAMVGGLLYAPVRMAEEFGWRGVFLRELRGGGFWLAAVVSGFLWGLWRVPLVLASGTFPGAPGLAAAVTIAASVPFGVLLAWLRVRSGTVWAAAAFQGTLTVLGPFHELVLRGATAMLASPMGVAGGLVVLGSVLVLFWRTPAGPEPVPT